eukprot:13969045-Heterocapsa_arctica.AAC.1
MACVATGSRKAKNINGQIYVIDGNAGEVRLQGEEEAVEGEGRRRGGGPVEGEGVTENAAADEEETIAEEEAADPGR